MKVKYREPKLHTAIQYIGDNEQEFGGYCSSVLRCDWTHNAGENFRIIVNRFDYIEVELGDYLVYYGIGEFPDGFDIFSPEEFNKVFEIVYEEA